ncbi:serine hydrolase domain-containing protein [Roseococcus sp. YIM B11640]|uniref:serine hydrolase domain-containing protein n=1 Tax=Roseococcus sp. YIM B11640 TaxID=3133973 RepID=UPI003C7D397B
MTDLDLLRLERRVAPLLALPSGAPGATIGIARGGEVLLHRSGGLASIELGVPIGPETTFRIASVSKQFTCAAIMLLAREGRLSPSDPVRQHLPGLSESLASITLDHLMRNSSGLRDMLELMRLGGVDLSMAVTDEQLDAAIRRQASLNFAPGTRFLYSNSGFRLLGQVVERVAGEPLEDFLERRIFAPLGMTRTRHTPDLAVPIPGLATGYLTAEGGFLKAPHGFPLGGEGGLVSCVEDLLIWAHAGDRALGGLVTELEGATAFENGLTNRYARGLQTDVWRGIPTLSHGGLWPGFKTLFLRVPAKDLAIVVIANHAGLDPTFIAYKALEAVLSEDPDVGPAPAPVDLAGMEGSWWSDEEGISFDMDAEGQLRMHGVAYTLAPTPDGRMGATRGSFAFTASPPRDDRMEVEFDAGHRSTFTRVKTPSAPELDGTWECEELGTRWIIEGREARAEGPIRNNGPWTVQGLGANHARIVIPSSLYTAWADAVLAKDAARLTVNAGRARRLNFRRIA